jgi:hypothetical protein
VDADGVPAQPQLAGGAGARGGTGPVAALGYQSETGLQVLSTLAIDIGQTRI